MKKRMWLWCMIAALGLSLNVACESDDESEDIVPPTGGTPIVPSTGGEQTPLPSDSIPVPPSTEVTWVDTIQFLETEKFIGHEGGTISLQTTTNQTWWIEVEKGVDWLTITDEGRAVRDYTIVVTVANNPNRTERSATITICFDDKEDTKIPVLITQEERPMAEIPTSVERTVTFVDGHGTVTEIYTLDMEPIVDSLGGAPDAFYMSKADGSFQSWSVTDGWFGENGAVMWGSGEAIFCMKPKADGTFAGGECCHPRLASLLPIVGTCTFRYEYTKTGKVIDIPFIVTVVSGK